VPNTEAVAVRPPQGREVVHRTHPSSLKPAGLMLPPAARVVLRWTRIRCRGWSWITRRSPEKESAEIKARFADPQTRMFPVAVTFLVPERLNHE
jgi:hypothetical protein